MLNHLRIKEVGVLQSYEMLDLGKINVVCGKNNSGKSTLVSAIATPGQVAMGKILSADDIEALQVGSLQATGWRGHDEHPRENRTVCDLVATLVQERAIWYEDDGEIFASTLTDQFKEISFLKRWAFTTNSVTHRYQELFRDRPDCVVIPPKRELELSRSLDLRETIAPGGAGILNYLLYAHNQPPGSRENDVYDKIGRAFRQISGGYSFRVFPDRENRISISFSSDGREWIHASHCGLGLQDLLVILYFSLNPSFGVVLIEEPESHLHPEMQKRLLLFLKNESDKQFFLTTHSNVFLDLALVDRVFFTSFSGMINIDDATSRASILGDLGYSVTDNLVSDLVILVEGPTDVPVVEEFLLKAGLYDRGQIRTWPLGGDIMDQLDLSVFAEKYSLIALLDQDPGSAAVRRRFAKHCKKLNIPVHHLQRYAIENYFSARAIRQVFGTQVPDEVAEIMPGVKLEDQIGINVKRNNRKIARAMTLGEVEATDFGAFLKRVGKLLPK